MKKIIIALIIIVVLVFLVKHFGLKKGELTQEKPNVETVGGIPESKVMGFQANESATFTVESKSSELKFIETGAKSPVVAHLPVDSGVISVDKGVLTGNLKINMKRLSVDAVGAQKDFAGTNALDISKFPNATFAIKALIFDRAQSTPENLVYRVDGELTIRGVTKPISLRLSVRFGADTLDVTGISPFDATSFGIAFPNSKSFNLGLTLTAKKN